MLGGFLFLVFWGLLRGNYYAGFFSSLFWLSARRYCLLGLSGSSRGLRVAIRGFRSWRGRGFFIEGEREVGEGSREKELGL